MLTNGPDPALHQCQESRALFDCGTARHRLSVHLMPFIMEAPRCMDISAMNDRNTRKKHNAEFKAKVALASRDSFEGFQDLAAGDVRRTGFKAT
jgi:hypothetical protein